MPSASKSSDSSVLGIQDFVGPKQKCVSLFSDNSKELVAAARKAKVMSNTATPYRPQSNGKAERTVGLCIVGGRTVLHQSGLAHAFWGLAVRHHCMSTNMTPPHHRGPGQVSACLKRHGAEFTGKRWPFGALCSFKIPRDCPSDRMKFDPDCVQGLFLGWFLQPGGKWTGAYLCRPCGPLR